MARARNIKPGLCRNEYLAGCTIQARYLAALIPCFADREGRLEDRPLRLKIDIFPADDGIDVNGLLVELDQAGYIKRYAIENNKYIQIVNFSKHQSPHVKEAPSTIPAPDKHQTSPVQVEKRQEPAPPDSHDSHDSHDCGKEHGQPAVDRFDEWWAQYPNKVKKKPAKAIWKRTKPDADILIADTMNRTQNDQRWKNGFIPDPTTYLNQERWNDELQKPKRSELNPVERSIQDGERYLAERRGIDGEVLEPDDRPLRLAVGKN